MVAPFRFDRGWSFAASPAVLWAALTDTGSYREWWPWLVALDHEGHPFTVGSRSHFTVQAPLPYRLHCTATIVDVEPSVLLVARVDGDLAGHASLALAPDRQGASAHLSWELDVQAATLRAFARVARPAMVWGHDRIVERGLREFEQRALEAPRATPDVPGDPSSAATSSRDVPRT